MAVDTDSRAAARPTGEMRAGLRGVLGGMAGGATQLWMRHGTVLGGLLILAYLAVIAAIGWLRPMHSWDMIAYLGAALRDQFELAGALHAHVWSEIRAVTDPGHFAALSQGDAFRTRQFTDPTAFESMLGMYAVKWLYVKLVGLLVPLVGAGHAGMVINAAALAGFGGVLIWWLRSVQLTGFAPLIIALLMIAGFADMAMGETPDLLNTVLATAAVLAIDRGRVVAGCIAAFAALLVRPDTIVLLAGLMAALWLWRQRAALVAAATFVAGLGTYMAISSMTDHPGWWPHLWFSTYAIQDTMAGFNPDLSARVYVTAFAWNLVRSAFENSWLGLYAAALGIWATLHAIGYRIGGLRSALLAATLGAVALKYAIFPLHDGRTYLPMLLPAFLVLGAELRAAFLKRQSAPVGEKPEGISS